MAARAESGVDVADRIVSSSEDEDEEEGQDRGEEEHIKQGELLIVYPCMHTPCSFVYVYNLSLCDVYLCAELSEIPLGELQKMREKLGTKK